MNKLKLFLLCVVVLLTTMTTSAATATYSNGRLTLDFIGEWAVVENATGNITVLDAAGNKAAVATNDAEYDFTNTHDYQVLVYQLTKPLCDGEYTVKIADGAIIGDKDDPWSFNLTSIGALDLPLTVVGSDVEPGDNTGDDSGNEGSGNEGSGDNGDEPGNIDSDVTVDFRLPSTLAAITDGMTIANITVDRAYYVVYWTITSEDDPDFFFGGANSQAGQGAGTYTIKASTPSAEAVELNEGFKYTFTFQVCEFGWDPYRTVAIFNVTGSGSAAQQFSDITITSFDGVAGALGYQYKKKYTVTFSDPVYNVKAFAPMGMDGVVDFTVKKASTDNLTWTIDCSSMEYEEGGFELHIQAWDLSNNLQLRGTYNLDHSFIYTIFISAANPDDNPDDNPDLPDEEVEIASITINGQIYHLSETTPIELASYPEGSVFTITLADEAIKKISYEIIDKTTDEIYKSVADLEKGNDGQWTAVMPRTYDLVAGHLYAIHVVARDGMSSFNSNILHEYNFLVNGTNQDVATYSTVKVVSIDPSTDEIITSANPVITISFSEAIATVSAKAILGQMMSEDIPANNITTSDNITWQISIPATAISSGSLSLNIYATDNEGNRVTDPEAGVGSPETCYLHYDWSSTIGLPVPTLAEEGKTLEGIETLTFEYDGIGLNQDNATATWNEITIACNGMVIDMTITEDMFTVAGDESVGGTQLKFTLKEPLREVGTYTITVPAYAFMLGHDQSNNYSGFCQFAVEVYNTDAINTIEAEHAASVIYNVDGTKADMMKNGKLYIVNGKKVVNY